MWDLVENYYFKNEIGNVGYETTYLPLKAYTYVITQPFGLKVL